MSSRDGLLLSRAHTASNSTQKVKYLVGSLMGPFQTAESFVTFWNPFSLVYAAAAMLVNFKENFHI